jgi:hypothetical protein
MTTGLGFGINGCGGVEGTAVGMAGLSASVEDTCKDKRGASGDEKTEDNEAALPPLTPAMTPPPLMLLLFAAPLPLMGMTPVAPRAAGGCTTALVAAARMETGPEALVPLATGPDAASTE